jgi:hypothetical protein
LEAGKSEIENAERARPGYGGTMGRQNMQLIPDDPIVQSIERTGYPPWIDADYEETDEEEDTEDGESDY